MNFSINFVERVTAVLKEAIQLKKYKAMPLYFAIPTGIFLLPVALIAAGLSALIYVLGYLFSVVLLPIESLYKLLHEDRRSNTAPRSWFIFFPGDLFSVRTLR